jgi:1,4-dihydroxy-2-naphthoate octaprenyltransferase
MMARMNPWILAARPKTLPAAAVPVLVGGALAQAAHAFQLLPWMICMVFALLIQIGTNYANDYYDYLKGADDHRRIGPDRAVASGWIRPEAMRRGMLLTFAAAFVFGSLLIPYGGWWLILVGALSIACGIAYTGGPYPLGYNGWGDVFVMIFFGWVATGVTYYVQAGTFAFPAPLAGDGCWFTFMAGIVPGALATNLLVVNNVRDEPLDREAGKRTLVVRFGRRFGLAEYAALAGLALLVPVLFALAAGLWGCLLVLLAAPFTVRTVQFLARAEGRRAYGIALVRTAILLIAIGGLFALGLVL